MADKLSGRIAKFGFSKRLPFTRKTSQAFRRPFGKQEIARADFFGITGGGTVYQVFISDTWSVSEALTKLSRKIVADTWQRSETFRKEIEIKFGDTWQRSEAFGKKVRKAVLDSWSVAESFTKFTRKAFSESASWMDSLAATFILTSGGWVGQFFRRIWRR